MLNRIRLEEQDLLESASGFLQKQSPWQLQEHIPLVLGNSIILQEKSAVLSLVDSGNLRIYQRKNRS